MQELPRITERLAKISDPATLLRNLFAHAPVAYQVLDSEGHSVVVNRAFIELFGSEPPPEYSVFRDNLAEAAGVAPMIRKAFQGETVRLPADWYDAREVEHIAVREGRRVAIEVTMFPLSDAEGVVKHVGVCFKDVTAEMEIRRTEERYRSLVEATSSIVWSVAPDGRFVSPNPQWEAYTGQRWEDLSEAGLTSAVHPDDVERVQAEWAEARARCTGCVLDFRLRHADSGRYRHVVARAAPLTKASGEIREWVGTITDVDDRRRAVDELARLEAQNKQVQEANRLKSEFLANMSHELRTPLNAIIGFAELIADRVVEPGSAQQDEFIQLILTSGHHLLQLINGVLDLAKVEAGKLQFEPETVAIARVVEEVCTILQPAAMHKQIQVSRELAPEPAEVEIDPARFKQVLYNYLSNALKFTSPGGHVIVRTRREGEDSFRLEVQDDGEGISEVDQRRLFFEFEQLDPSTAKRHGGTGLGLALTKRLVEAQGGEVGATSALGRGSTFFAVLPIRPRAGAGGEAGGSR